MVSANGIPSPTLLVMSNSANEKLPFILGRRSIRIYAPGPIAGETLTLLLQAAMAAPSAMTKDPWRFVVAREPALLAGMAAALPGGKMLATATLAILACGDLDAAFERHPSYLLQDCSAAIENLLLAAHHLGLGACWVGIHPSQEAIGLIRKMFSLPCRSFPSPPLPWAFPEKHSSRAPATIPTTSTGASGRTVRSPGGWWGRPRVCPWSLDLFESVSQRQRRGSYQPGPTAQVTSGPMPEG